MPCAGEAAAPAVQFIAEVYNPQEYRSYIAHGGFDFLYDKVGLYDTLRGVICRYASASAITQLGKPRTTFASTCSIS